MKLIVFGTRPEEIKLYPFTKYEGYEFLMVDQSRDLHQGLISAKYTCGEDNLKECITKLNPEVVIVQGDTRTAFRAALYAYESKILVAHVEAGLRTWDLNDPHPEEGYRRMIDDIAAYRFCSTKEAVMNCDGDYVGQTAIDTLFEFYPKGVQEEDFYIVTVHRTPIEKVLRFFEDWGKTPIKVFAHPNKYGQDMKKHFDCLNPLPYREFLNLLARARGCISDSGGLQEECIALGKDFISLRDKTERGHGESYAPGATEKIINILENKNVHK